MSNDFNPVQAQMAYCKLLKLIQETSQNAANFPGPEWEPVFEKLNEALLKSKEILANNGIDPKYINCD